MEKSKHRRPEEVGCFTHRVGWLPSADGQKYILCEYMDAETLAGNYTQMIKEYSELSSAEYFKLKVKGDDALREYSSKIIDVEKWK